MNPKHWPAVPIGALGKGAGTTWRYIEPSRGTYKWYGLDEYVNAAERHGVDLLYTFDGTPQWASARPNAPPADIQDWDDFVTSLATRYRGRIKIYELWNEPNTQAEWSGSYEDMVKLARHAYRIIKAIDPGAVVLTPAPSAQGYHRPGYTSAIQFVWMRDYLRGGGNSYADGGSWHAYPWRNACAPWITCAGLPLVRQINVMRSVFDGSGMAGDPMYVTEGGWQTDDKLRDRHQQAAYVARWYILLASSGVARAYWYAWDEDRWGTLWDPVNGVHEAGIAYEQVYRWLIGASFTSPCSESGNRVWKCELSRPRGSQGLIVWSDSGQARYHPPSQYPSYRDLTGHVTPMTGQKELTIGESPILFEASDALHYAK